MKKTLLFIALTGIACTHSMETKLSQLAIKLSIKSAVSEPVKKEWQGPCPIAHAFSGKPKVADNDAGLKLVEYLYANDALEREKLKNDYHTKNTILYRNPKIPSKIWSDPIAWQFSEQKGWFLGGLFPDKINDFSLIGNTNPRAQKLILVKKMGGGHLNGTANCERIVFTGYDQKDEEINPFDLEQYNGFNVIKGLTGSPDGEKLFIFATEQEKIETDNTLSFRTKTQILFPNSLYDRYKNCDYLFFYEKNNGGKWELKKKTSLSGPTEVFSSRIELPVDIKSGSDQEEKPKKTSLMGMYYYPLIKKIAFVQQNGFILFIPSGEGEVDKTNILSRYFAERGVCKSLSSSVTTPPKRLPREENDFEDNEPEMTEEEMKKIENYLSTIEADDYTSYDDVD